MRWKLFCAIDVILAAAAFAIVAGPSPAVQKWAAVPATRGDTLYAVLLVWIGMIILWNDLKGND